MLQDKSDELKAGNEEKNILLKHTENLEEILREKDKHIDSLKMELKKTGKSRLIEIEVR